jgi:hypothetical protein
MFKSVVRYIALKTEINLYLRVTELFMTHHHTHFECLRASVVAALKYQKLDTNFTLSRIIITTHILQTRKLNKIFIHFVVLSAPYALNCISVDLTSQVHTTAILVLLVTGN